MVAQLTYDADPVLGFSGMLSQNFNQPKMVESRIAETAVLYGAPVEAGTLPDQVVPLATTTLFAGVAIFAHTQESSTQYDAGKSLPMMTSGRVWVIAGGAVAIGAQVTAQLDGKFDATGTGASNVKCVALTAAAAEEDIIEIELLGTQL